MGLSAFMSLGMVAVGCSHASKQSKTSLAGSIGTLINDASR